MFVRLKRLLSWVWRDDPAEKSTCYLPKHLSFVPSIMSGSLQPPITLAPSVSDALFWLLPELHTHTHAKLCRHTHTHN